MNMNINISSRSNNRFLSIAVLLAVGVLTGCQYCEPLLMVTLVIGAIYRGLAYTPSERATCLKREI